MKQYNKPYQCRLNEMPLSLSVICSTASGEPSRFIPREPRKTAAAPNVIYTLLVLPAASAFVACCRMHLLVYSDQGLLGRTGNARAMLFIFHPIYYLFSPSYTRSRNSDPGPHGTLFSPLPNTAHALHFYRQKILAVSSLVNSRRIVHRSVRTDSSFTDVLTTITGVVVCTILILLLSTSESQISDFTAVPAPPSFTAVQSSFIAVRHTCDNSPYRDARRRCRRLALSPFRRRKHAIVSKGFIIVAISSA